MLSKNIQRGLFVGTIGLLMSLYGYVTFIIANPKPQPRYAQLLNDYAQQNNPNAPYALGRTLFFTKKNGENYLKTGWSKAEEDGRWSEGITAHLAIALDSTDDIQMTIDAEAFTYPNKVREQTITLTVNGTLVKTWTRQNEQHTIQETITLPKNTLTAANDDFLFTISQPSSPLTLGISDDARNLGLKLKSIKFEKTKTGIINSHS